MSSLLSALDEVRAVDPHELPGAVLLAETELLLRARDQLDGLLATRLQALDARDVTVHECGRTTRSWLVEEQRLSRDDAARRMLVARMLPFHPHLATALATGEISQEHSRVILGCLRRLTPSWAIVAEPELVEAARQVDPTSLGQLCREVRLRAGADEDAEAAAQRIYESRWLRVTKTFEGMTSIEGMLDPEAGATLAAALTPLCRPVGPEDTRTSSQRRADALTELARTVLAHGGLPDHGGDRPQVLITIPWAELRDGLPDGQLSAATLNGEPTTPATVRRIACDAGLIPAVLNGPSEILDLGRSQRLFSRAQRRAAALRDRGCVWPKCQEELARCQLHHLDDWAHLGQTDISRSAYLCVFHHWLTHHSTWRISRDSQGRIEVHRT